MTNKASESDKASGQADSKKLTLHGYLSKKYWGKAVQNSVENPAPTPETCTPQWVKRAITQAWSLLICAWGSEMKRWAGKQITT